MIEIAKAALLTIQGEIRDVYSAQCKSLDYEDSCFFQFESDRSLLVTSVKDGAPRGPFKCRISGLLMESIFDDDGLINGPVMLADQEMNYSYKGNISKGELFGDCEIVTQDAKITAQIDSSGSISGLISESIASDHEHYIGGFIDGHRSSTFILSNSEKQTTTKGNLESSLLSGFGVTKTAEWMYSGCFENNKKSGVGIEVSANTDYYFGEWKEDKKWGLGVEKRENEIFRGQFVRGIRYGFGWLQRGENGRVRLVEYDRGILMRAGIDETKHTELFEKIKRIEELREGDWVSKNEIQLESKIETIRKEIIQRKEKINASIATLESKLIHLIPRLITPSQAGSILLTPQLSQTFIALSNLKSATPDERLRAQNSHSSSLHIRSIAPPDLESMQELPPATSMSIDELKESLVYIEKIEDELRCKKTQITNQIKFLELKESCVLPFENLLIRSSFTDNVEKIQDVQNINNPFEGKKANFDNSHSPKCNMDSRFENNTHLLDESNIFDGDLSVSKLKWDVCKTARMTESYDYTFYEEVPIMTERIRVDKPRCRSKESSRSRSKRGNRREGINVMDLKSLTKHSKTLFSNPRRASKKSKSPNQKQTRAKNLGLKAKKAHELFYRGRSKENCGGVINATQPKPTTTTGYASKFKNKRILMERERYI